VGSYTHNEKAGNRGDVVKHAALMASLGTILQEWTLPTLEFADTFAGGAFHPLSPGARMGWPEGIGKVANLGGHKFAGPFLQQWFDWYIASRPGLSYGTYPGSTVIALDVGAYLQKRVHVAAWDTAADAVGSLMSSLGQGHCIRARAADPSEKAVTNADFLFIDPPSQSDHWPTIIRFLPLQLDNVLVFLPISRDRHGTLRSADSSMAHARSLGYQGVRVIWHPSVRRRTTRCQLLFRFRHHSEAAAALCYAVSEMALLPVWSPSWQVTFSF
jgi:23S rRNA A2030 N6-methylase RlmJ